MFVKALLTLILVVSLFAKDILAAIYGRHEPFHCKRTELMVTNSIYIIVNQFNKEKLLLASNTLKDVAVCYAMTLVANTYVLLASFTIALSNSSTTANGAEFVQQPKLTLITLATMPFTLAAVLTTIATAFALLTTNTFKKHGLAYNNATLTQFFISSNSKVLQAYNQGQETSGLASGLEYMPML